MAEQKSKRIDIWLDCDTGHDVSQKYHFLPAFHGDHTRDRSFGLELSDGFDTCRRKSS